MNLSLNYGVCSDIGNVRKLNEDHCYANAQLGIFIVADGMGGYSKGDYASQITTKYLSKLLKHRVPIKAAIEACHLKIKAICQQSPESFTMGTTVVCALFWSQFYQIAWTGDSRAYLFNQKTGLKQLSHDHTYVQELLDKGLITHQEFLNYPKKHLLTSALGSSSEEALKIGLVSRVIVESDLLMLCSDGITNELKDSEIVRLLELNIDNQAKAKKMVTIANLKGGKDNSSVIIISHLNYSQQENNSGHEDITATQPLKL